MAAPTTLAEAVAQALLQPKTVTENGRTITNRTLKELLDAAARQSSAESKPGLGLRFTKLIPPGSY